MLCLIKKKKIEKKVISGKCKIPKTKWMKHGRE